MGSPANLLVTVRVMRWRREICWFRCEVRESVMTMSMRPWMFCLIVLGIASSWLNSAVADDKPRKPNIVFILADDLGYTDVGCFGSKFYETPNIDRLASKGMRFTNGYTCGPNCQPTRAAFHSGQYGPRTGVYTVGSIDRFAWQTRPLRPVENVQKLPLEKVTLAESLKKAGYATGMFGKWHLGNDEKHHPLSRGFDEAVVSEGKHFQFETNPPTPHDKEVYLADFLTNKAVNFIRRHQDEPFFLYLPHFGVHAPHEAKQESIDRFKSKAKVEGHHSAVYAAMIASVDESVGRVVSVLEELNLTDDTLVIFTSDNGGVGGYEREGIQGGSITDNSPLKGGKGMLYEGGIRVPYVFYWPGKIKAGTIQETPILSVDLYPTLLQVGGGSAPKGQALDGESYWPLLTGGAERVSREAIFWHFPGYLGAGGGTWRTAPVGAVRSGDWKLMEFFEDGHFELYNLREDVGERKNLADADPKRVMELKKLLHDWRSQVGAKLPTPQEPVKGEVKQAKSKKRKGADD